MVGKNYIIAVSLKPFKELQRPRADVHWKLWRYNEDSTEDGRTFLLEDFLEDGKLLEMEDFSYGEKDWENLYAQGDIEKQVSWMHTELPVSACHGAYRITGGMMDHL